jgi:hypothetical protein
MKVTQKTLLKIGNDTELLHHNEKEIMLIIQKQGNPHPLEIYFTLMVN